VVSRKPLSSQRKIWFGFQESVFSFGCVCFLESGFRETTFQTFLCLFAIRKVGQQKTLSSQKKIILVFMKVFSWIIWAERKPNILAEKFSVDQLF